VKDLCIYKFPGVLISADISYFRLKKIKKRKKHSKSIENVALNFRRGHWGEETRAVDAEYKLKESHYPSAPLIVDPVK
jgi:hypothetical protein